MQMQLRRKYCKVYAIMNLRSHNGDLEFHLKGNNKIAVSIN